MSRKAPWAAEVQVSIDQHASVGAMPRVPLSVLTAHRVCLARDRYGRPLYNREERAARARGVPDAAELTARVAVVVGLVRPVALETLPATGTWGAVASALDCSEARAQADWEALCANGKKDGLGLAVAVAEVVLAVIAGNIREVCEGVIGRDLSSRDWQDVAVGVRKAMVAIRGSGEIQPLVDASLCSRSWESAPSQWQHQASQQTGAWEKEAAHYFDWSSRTTLVDLRDHTMRVPTNPAVSTALPFNAAVEVLADGILASHKAHYSLNYSAKMGITDATVRILVFAALRKQQLKPDAADLDAAQESRRAMSASLMAVCGKMTFPAHLMATYMLGQRDFYVSHDFVDVHHFSYHPFRRQPRDDDADDGGAGGSNGGADGGTNAIVTCNTWFRAGGRLHLTSQLASYTSRCDPALASNDGVLWAPAPGDGFGNLPRMGVLAYRVAVRDSIGSGTSSRSRPYHVVADDETSALVQGHCQVPAAVHRVAVIRPHYAYSGLKQPEIWRVLCQRLAGVYRKPCSFGVFGGNGLSCGCFAADPTGYEACGADARDRSTAVTDVVRQHVVAVMSHAGQADADDLVAYCLFWRTYLVPFHGVPPGFRTDTPAEQLVCEFAAAHLQWQRHRCLLWEGMRLRFEPDNEGARTRMALHSAPMVGDLVVVGGGRGLGVVRAQVGAGAVRVTMLRVATVDARYHGQRIYELTATNRTFPDAELYGHLDHWRFELCRSRSELVALDRDALLTELFEADDPELDRRALQLASSSDVDDEALRQLLFAWCRDPGSAVPVSTTRSGRASNQVQRLPAGSARGDNRQDDRPRGHIRLRRSARMRVEELCPPISGRLLAVVDADVYGPTQGRRVGAAKYPLPYWLAIVHCAAVTDEQWLGDRSIDVRYLEDPTPVYRDGQLLRWEYKSYCTDACSVPRKHVLCQLPELDGPVRAGGVVHVSEELHSRCCDAACRRAGMELCVGPYTGAAERSGCYDVTCTGDGAALSLTARSHGLCSTPVTGRTMQVRLAAVQLRVFPWYEPLPSQRAVLTLPGGARALGTLRAAKLTVGQAPGAACPPVSFGAAVGRGAHAYHNLKRLQNVHGLNGDDAKQAEKDRMQQTVRDLREQGLDDEAAPPGWLRTDRDGSDNAVPDEVEAALLIGNAAAQLTKMAGDAGAPPMSSLTASALTGLGNAATRMRAGDDDGDDDGGVAANPAAASTSTGDDAPVHIPADRHVATRIRADLAEFKRKLAEANKQTSTAPPAAAVQNARGQPRSLGPPLTPLPPNGLQVADRALATADPTCRLSIGQTLRTGAPDRAAGTPFGSPMNQGQGEATCIILDALGFESEATAQVGTTAVGSNMFPAGHLRLYQTVGEPGTGKSVVLDAVRRHLVSHGWTHDQFRVLAATGKAAASVCGGTFASFKGQTGCRAKVGGEAPPKMPPGIQPVFDAGQKKRLRERFGRLRVVFVDEYEMLKLQDFAVGAQRPHGGPCAAARWW
jgi:hypothetical protein